MYALIRLRSYATTDGRGVAFSFSFLSPPLSISPFLSLSPSLYFLHHLAVVPSQPPASVPPPLARFVGPEDGAAQHDQLDKVQQAQGLGLEDFLQPGEVDDQQLAGKAERDGPVEQCVGEEADLAPEHRLGLGPAGQGVEHVEEHEAGEGHGRVAACDLTVLEHLVRVHEQGEEHDDEG